MCTVTLDETTTDHITIKSMTNVTIYSDKLIDDEYNQIETEKGASVELTIRRTRLVYYVI